MEGIIYTFLVLIILFLIITLPLHLSVKMLGGKTSLLKTFGVILIGAIINIIVAAIFPFAAIISFILLIWLYRESFRLKWIKAIIVWVLQFVLMIVFGTLTVLLGIATLSSLLIF